MYMYNEHCIKIFNFGRIEYPAIRDVVEAPGMSVCTELTDRFIQGCQFFTSEQVVKHPAGTTLLTSQNEQWKLYRLDCTSFWIKFYFADMEQIHELPLLESIYEYEQVLNQTYIQLKLIDDQPMEFKLERAEYLEQYRSMFVCKMMLGQDITGHTNVIFQETRVDKYQKFNERRLELMKSLLSGENIYMAKR